MKLKKIMTANLIQPIEDVSFTRSMIGMNAEKDHMFGLKLLISELSHLGFSISYDEVVKCEQ